MVEMTEVAIVTMSEYVSLSTDSMAGYMVFKVSITGRARFFNSKSANPFKSSATMSPRENGPTIWKRDQITYTLHLKFGAHATVDNQCLLPGTESNFTSDEARGEYVIAIPFLTVLFGTIGLCQLLDNRFLREDGL